MVKRDADEWLSRMDENVLEREVKNEKEESLEGSKLISKYNEILNQYSVKMKN